jgi:hypothetical protein
MLVFCFYTFLMLLCCWHCLLMLLLVLRVGYCCFCHAILLALFLYIIAPHTPSPFLATFHIVDPLVLPLLSCCYSFHIAILALLFLSCCSSFIVAPFTFQRLLANLCCSSYTTILDRFALLLLCFV